MSKFHLLNIISVLLLLAILTAGGQVVVSILILAVIYLVFLAIGSIFIQFNFYFKSLNSGQTNQKQIAITFDDGPDSETTQNILVILEKHKAVATFFCIGEKIEQQKELLKKIDSSGHGIGNHSFSHSNFFPLSSSKKIAAELKSTNELIEKIIGKKPKLFRPPFGVTNPTIAKALKSSGFIAVGWSLRSFDTIHDSKKVFKKLKRKLKAGDIVLFHDNRKNTPELLESFLPWLKENHFKVIGLDELLQIETYEKI